MGLTKTELGRFYTLTRYSVSDFLDISAWDSEEAEESVLFGLFTQPDYSQVHPVAVIEKVGDYYGYLLTDQTIDNKHETRFTCLCCRTECHSSHISYINRFELVEASPYIPEQITDSLPSEYTDSIEGYNAIGVGFGSEPTTSAICTGCFTDFKTIAESIYSEHRPLVLSFEI